MVGRGGGADLSGCPQRTHSVRSGALSASQDRQRDPPGTTASAARPGSAAGPTYGSASRSPGRRNGAPARPADVASEGRTTGGAIGRPGTAGSYGPDDREARDGRDGCEGCGSLNGSGAGSAGAAAAAGRGAGGGAGGDPGGGSNRGPTGGPNVVSDGAPDGGPAVGASLGSGRVGGGGVSGRWVGGGRVSSQARNSPHWAQNWASDGFARPQSGHVLMPNRSPT